MSFLQGIETGRGMARGAITAYETSNLRRREEEAAKEIAALNEQYRRSGEVVEEPPASTGLAPNQVSRVSAAGAPTAAGLTRYQMGSAAGAPVDQRPTRTIDATRGPTLGGAPTQPVTQPVTPQPRRQMTESEFNRQRANVYARMGLADRAAEATEAAMQAERYEQQTARQSRLDEIAQQQYEREFRLTSARDERDAAREVREQGLYEENRAVRAQTRAALSAVVSGKSFDEALTQNPSADIATLIEARNRQLDYNTQVTTRAARAALLQTISEDPNQPITQVVQQVLAENPEADPEVLLATAASAVDLDVAQWKQQSEVIGQRIQQANTPAAFDAVLEQFFDPDTEDDISPKVRRVPVDPDAPDGAQMWVVMYGDSLMAGVPPFADIGDIEGWQFIKENFAGAYNGQGPLSGAILHADYKKALQSEGSGMSLDQVYTLARQMTSDQIGDNLSGMTQKAYQDAFFANVEAIMQGGPTDGSQITSEQQRAADYTQEFERTGSTRADTEEAAARNQQTRQSLEQAGQRLSRIQEQIDIQYDRLQQLAKDNPGVSVAKTEEGRIAIALITRLKQDANTAAVIAGIPQPFRETSGGLTR